MKRILVKNGRLDESDMIELVNVLENDGLIIYPTDTIYGLGCSATSNIAVEKVKQLKGRSPKDVFSVMVDSIETIKKYAQVGMLEEQFLKKYLPGPVTVILKLQDEVIKNNKLNRDVINMDGATGFRVIDRFEFISSLCKKFGKPIITTSANKSGQGKHESSLEYVLGQFADKLNEIDIVLDVGSLSSDVPSTVVDLSKTPHTILRRGMEDIAESDL